MNEFKRTFRTDRIYFQILKPKGLEVSSLSRAVELLEQHGFIETGQQDRYSETEKLTNGQNKRELFKLIERIRKEVNQ